MVRTSDQKVIAEPCIVAETVWSRVRGLIGADKLEPGSGMLLRPCSSIHTFFMKFAIDAVFLDAEGRVVAVRRGLKPWKLDWPVLSAHSVLELPEGGAQDLREGDLLCLS